MRRPFHLTSSGFAPRPGIRGVSAVLLIALIGPLQAAPPDAGATPLKAVSSSGTEQRAARAALTPAAAPAGAAARIAVLERGRVVVRPNGTRQRLPAAYQHIARAQGLVFASHADGESDERLDLIDRQGRIRWSRPVFGAVAVNRSSGLAAWASPAGRLLTHSAAGVTRLRSGPALSSVFAVFGDRSCEEQRGGCSVYYDGTSDGVPHSVSTHGNRDLLDPRLSDLADARRNRVLGTDNDGCLVLLGAGWNRPPKVRTCRHRSVSISPDGRHLLAEPLRDSSRRALTVLDARTGRVVTKVVSPRRREGRRMVRVIDRQWEDTGHVLAVTRGPRGWDLVRISLDGDLARVSGPARGSTYRPAFALESR